MLTAQKIALIELGTSHDECLYAQVAYLKSRPRCSIRIYCSPKIAERIAPWADDNEVEILKQKLRWKDFYRLYKSISKGRFNTVIFNTGQGPHIRKLLLFPFSKSINFIASIHNINRLETSRSQKAISRKVNKYLVLNDYLLKALAEKNFPKLRFNSYYPILYPSYPEVEIAKPPHEIWIVIPGQVENQRRDYPSLLKNLAEQKPPKHIRFILLGASEHSHGDGKLLKEQIQQAGLSVNFKLWPGFIAMNEFYTYLKMADFIMPLIHSNHSSGQTYRSQVSGSYNLAFAFKKCLLMDKAYREIEDFKDSAEFYDPDNLLEFIKALKPHDKQDLYQNQKWSFYYQSLKFWAFIES
jgi:hypothetical protein